MRKKLFAKRLTAFLLATALVVTGTGCGKGDGGGKGKDGKKSEQVDVSNCTYKEEETLPEEIKDVNEIFISGETMYFFCNTWVEDNTGKEASEEGTSEEGKEEASEEGTSEEEKEETSEEGTSEEEKEEGSEEGTSEEEKEEEDSEDYGGHSEYHLYAMDINSNEVSEVTLPEIAETEWICSILSDSKGDIYYVISSYSEKEEKQSYSIVSMNTNGEELLNVDISQDIGNSEESYFGTMRIDAEDNLYITSGDKTIIIFDKNGKKTGEIKADGYLIGLAKAKDGSLIAGVNDNETGDIQICTIDVKGGKLTSPKKMEDIGSYSSNSLIDGLEYDIYYQGNEGIYGYDLASEKSTKVMDFIASNIETMGINKLLAMSKDKFLISGYGNDDTKSSYVSIYTKVDPKDVEERIDITYAGSYVMEEVKSAAVAFNKANDKYRVIIKDYSSGDDPETEMATDLLSGDVPDIIDLSNGYSDQYIAKGMLEDMYPMLEADKDISKDDFLETPLKALETDGKLYCISPAFYINTVVGAKDDLGEIQSWTIEDLIEYDESKGDGATALGQNSRTDVLYSLVSGNINKYVDWSTGKCSFDNDEFVDILDYASTYPEEYEYNEDDESYPSQVKSGKILLVTGSLGIDELQLYKAMYGKDITCVGYPTQEGSGTYASYQYQMGISSKSEHKEAAWEFIKTFLTDDFAYKNVKNGMGGIPLRKDSYEEFIKIHSATESFTDSHGEEVQPYETSWGWDDLEVDIKPSSEEDIKMLQSIIETISSPYSYNYKIMDIIVEEAEEFFKGKNDAKTAAGNINNRVSTYVNENR